MAAALTAVLAVCAVLGVQLFVGRRSAIQQRTAISPRLSGRLPLAVSTINEVGYGLLLRASALISAAVAINEVLESEMLGLGQQWLESMQTAQSESAFARLLQQAADLMVRIQTSDDIFHLLPGGIKTDINGWITDFGR